MLDLVVLVLTILIVLAPASQRRKGHGQLGAQVTIPSQGNCEVQNLHRHPHSGANPEAEDLCRKGGTRKAGI